MADVPEHEISALRVLSEYEQMLGMDRIIKQYGITEAELLARLQPAPGPFTKIKDSVVSGDLHTERRSQPLSYNSTSTASTASGSAAATGLP